MATTSTSTEYISKTCIPLSSVCLPKRSLLHSSFLQKFNYVRSESVLWPFTSAITIPKLNSVWWQAIRCRSWEGKLPLLPLFLYFGNPFCRTVLEGQLCLLRALCNTVAEQGCILAVSVGLSWRLFSFTARQNAPGVEYSSVPSWQDNSCSWTAICKLRNKNSVWFLSFYSCFALLTVYLTSSSW